MEEKFIDRLKRVSGCIWVLFALLIIAGLFLILGGGILLAATKDSDTRIGAIACIVVGIICDLFFLGIGIILPYVQWKKGISAESRRVWPSGVLTDKIIKKDIQAHFKTRIVGCFTAAALLGIIAVLVAIFSNEIDIVTLIIIAAPIVMLVIAVKDIIFVKRLSAYRIETDRLVDAKVETTFDVVDAVTDHLPTKTPTLYFEKHGKYMIDSMHIHPYYFPEEIVSCIDIGEEVFIVYHSDSDTLLHIYRKKHWTLEE